MHVNSFKKLPEMLPYDTDIKEVYQKLKEYLTENLKWTVNEDSLKL